MGLSGIATVVTTSEGINNFTVNSACILYTVFKIRSRISIVIETLLISSYTIGKAIYGHTIKETTSKDGDNQDLIINRLQHQFAIVDVDMNQHLNLIHN